MIEWIGYLAAIITTSCYLPQAWHVIYTRKTEGISLLSYSMLFTGVALWTIYGVMIANWPLILANVITLVPVSIILALKIKLG